MAQSRYNGGMTILVTGATGFVGSAVARKLIAAGEAVRVMSRKGSDTRNIDDLTVERVTGDLTDPESLKAAVEGCEGVYHVAADYRIWVPDPPSIYRANVDGSRDLIRAAQAAGVKRIVYTSSVAVLGFNNDGSPADETTPVTVDDMIGHYKRSKFVAEEVVKSLIRDENAPVVIVNPSAPIGPRDIKPTPTGELVIEAATGRMPGYVDTGLNLVHVDDVAAGHVLAFEKGVVGERYVLGGENLSLREILEKIAAITGRRAPRLKLPHNLILGLAHCVEGATRLFGDREPFLTVDSVRMAKKHMYFSSAKAERELGYTHRPADEALRDAIEWFGRNGYLD